MKKNLYILLTTPFLLLAEPMPQASDYYPNASKKPIETKTPSKYRSSLFKKDTTEDVFKGSQIPKKVKEGLSYGIQTGKRELIYKKDESGNYKLKNIETYETYTSPPEKSHLESYKNSIKSYNTALINYNKQKSLIDFIERKIDKESKQNNPNQERIKILKTELSKEKTKLPELAKKVEEEAAQGRKERNKDFVEHGGANDLATIGMTQYNPTLSGQDTVNSFFKTKDKNLSEYYKNGYQINPKEVELPNDPKVQKIKKAYNFLNQFEQNQNARLSKSYIKCYMTRELIPSFYCPLPDKTGVNYPDLSRSDVDPTKVSSQEAESQCNKDCQQDSSCVEYNLLNSDTEKIVKDKEIFKNQSTYPANIEIPINMAMQLESIVFDINITKSPDANKSTPIYIKLDVEKADLQAKNYDIFIKGKRYKLDDNLIHVNITAKQITPSINLVFYKPYADHNKTINAVRSIKIQNIQTKYTSKKLFFCPALQEVDSTSECPNGTIFDLTSSSNVTHICANTEHKIGPDPINGAFYTKNSCEAVCKINKKCKPTYRQYSNLSNNAIFKVKVGCMTDKSGAASVCTPAQDQLCKDYFADTKKRPVNEITIKNDNTRVYTIKYGASTKEPRPKITYSKETSQVLSKSERKKVFQVEMKDNAYSNMIKENNYNIISRVIGDYSPEQKAVKIFQTENGTALTLKIKGDSSLYDTGKKINIYQVMLVKHFYKPKFGLFMKPGKGNFIDGKDHDVRFQDITYAIKTGDGFWKPYRRILFDSIREKEVKIICEDQAYTKRKGEIIPEGCHQKTIINWAKDPLYTKDNFEIYLQGADTYVNFDPQEKAPISKKIYFSSEEIIKRLQISNAITTDIINTPGILIHYQKESDDSKSLLRKYNSVFKPAERSYIRDIEIYAFTSEGELTYQNLDDYIKEENLIWKKSNPAASKQFIIDDTELGTNIKAFVVGPSNKTSIKTEITPKFGEEGKHVFKFLFLKDQ